LAATPQDPEWHPEGDVWVHTLMVVDAAAAVVARGDWGLVDREPLHVVLGALQDERAPLLALLLGGGFVALAWLHLAAAQRERRVDRERRAAGADGWVEVGRVEEIAEKRAKIVALGGERVAIFRYDGKLSALSNVCQHQNGPLGEGKLEGSIVTCPLHQWKFDVNGGQCQNIPAVKLKMFEVKVEGEDIFIKV